MKKELRVQVNRQIACGIHGIFALGTNGEVYALTEEEKLDSHPDRGGWNA